MRRLSKDKYPIIPGILLWSLKLIFILLILIMFYGNRSVALASKIVNVESIKIELKDDLLIIGKQYKIKTTVYPKNATNKRIEWISSNESIATVSKGIVKPLLPGTVTITALSQDGSNIKGNLELQIVQPVKKILLSEASVNLAPGTTWKLKATVEPANASNKNVIWKSTNEKIAVIESDGTIKGLKKGKTKIVATAADGSKINSSVSVNVSEYDFVFTKNDPQIVRIDDFKNLNVEATAKNNNVIVEFKKTRSWDMIITPLNVGEDLITFHAGGITFKHTVYVAQTAVPKRAAVPQTIDQNKIILWIQANSKENLLFSKYNIEMYLDGQYIKTITNGEHDTWITVLAKEGKHEIYFQKEDGEGKSKTVSFFLEDFSYLILNTSSNRNGVSIESHSLQKRYDTGSEYIDNELKKYDQLIFKEKGSYNAAYGITIRDNGWGFNNGRKYYFLMNDASINYALLSISKDGNSHFLLNARMDQTVYGLDDPDDYFILRVADSNSNHYWIDFHRYKIHRSQPERSYPLVRNDMVKVLEIFVKFKYPSSYKNYQNLWSRQLRDLNPDYYEKYYGTTLR